jgi:2-keto-4-pentenoate hydratase/2-oxohepta-3-ene-1,7-dioic acid hydratase in catechol pathway
MRIGEPGRERPAVRLDDGHYVDVSDRFADFDEAFFGSGGIESVRALAKERAAAGQVREFGGGRVGAPIPRPHQIICVGLNYADHARETGQAVPAEPILFNKAPNTLIGGKSAETFNPAGPWLATPDEVREVRALDLNSASRASAHSGSS